jgi:hypothetical protein
MLFQQYQPIVLPIDYGKGFFELSAPEVDSYFKWFLENKESRLVQLYKLFFIDVVNPLSENNLKITEWVLRSAVSYMPKIVVKSKNTHYQKVELDARTFSICYDISIFWGELMISLDENICWVQEKDKRYADYGEPMLLKKRNKSFFIPFRSSTTIAHKMYDDTYKEDEVIQMFNYLKKKFDV